MLLSLARPMVERDGLSIVTLIFHTSVEGDVPVPVLVNEAWHEVEDLRTSQVTGVSWPSPLLMDSSCEVDFGLGQIGTISKDMSNLDSHGAGELRVKCTGHEDI